jgi:hypothetical protein
MGIIEAARDKAKNRYEAGMQSDNSNDMRLSSTLA